jgi:hypothetical protein
MVFDDRKSCKFELKNMALIQFVTFFHDISMVSLKFGAGAVRNGAASRCDTGSTKIMGFHAAPAPHQCFQLVVSRGTNREVIL